MEDSTRFWRDPLLPFAESRRACRSRACYRPHAHPTYSIGAVDEGRSVFGGAGLGEAALCPGTLVLVPPARVHACNPARDAEWSYQMLHLDADWVRGIACEAGSEDPFASIAVVTDPAAYGRFCRLNALLFSDAATQAKETALIEFVGAGAGWQGARGERPSAPDVLRRKLEPVFELLRGSGSDAPSLAALAELAGMSRYQLIRAFRTVTGLTPHAWHLNHRVNLARDRLRAGGDLAGIAYGLGFSDQSHFQRVFKAHAGVTPLRYRGKAAAISSNTRRR